MSTLPILSTQACKRLHAGELILDGFDNDEIADVLKCSTSAVSRWRKKLNDNNDDLCALLRKKKEPDSRQDTSDEQKQQLKDIILKGAVAAGYPHERWTSKIVADLIQKTFNITLAPRTVRRLLKGVRRKELGVRIRKRHSLLLPPNSSLSVEQWVMPRTYCIALFLYL